MMHGKEKHLTCPGQNFKVIQYVDDTLMIMLSYIRQLLQLKGILNCFSVSAGLHVNYHKSTVVPNKYKRGSC
jgi:hypothetical protein